MSDAVRVDPNFLREHPLPQTKVSAGKDERGTVLIIGASREVPGAILLAAEAALRAGASTVPGWAPRATGPGAAAAA